MSPHERGDQISVAQGVVKQANPKTSFTNGNQAYPHRRTKEEYYRSTSGRLRDDDVATSVHNVWGLADDCYRAEELELPRNNTHTGELNLQGRGTMGRMCGFCGRIEVDSQPFGPQINLLTTEVCGF